MEVLPAVVRAWHETTGQSGYTHNEILFGKHNCTKGPPLAEPKGVVHDAAHYFQRREELIALARSEAGSDPRGHLWVTWGVYLCAGNSPLADIILSHPPDLT